MRVINAINVNDAFKFGVDLLKKDGQIQDSRAGRVLVYPEPVTTEYMFPQQRVLFHSVRDANPLFHLFEALWMLAGRNDARFLDQFVSDFSSRFAESDGHMHGAYGFRWRKHFEPEGGGTPLDQLDEVVYRLKHNPNDRQVVLAMWDPMADFLLKGWKDLPCNTHAYFRVRGEVLDMTVCCRSNDIWWGAYGANAVHFSILQEYLACRIGVRVGTYYQISNNFHMYTDVVKDIKFEADPYYTRMARATPIVTDPVTFDGELSHFLDEDNIPDYHYTNSFFPKVAQPLWDAHRLWKAKERYNAHLAVMHMDQNCDWVYATRFWMERRMSMMAVGKERV